MKTKKRNLLNLFICFVFASFIMGGCSMKSAGLSILEGGAAYMEKPSMELVLDRMNTAAAAARLSEEILKNIVITDTTDWPQRITGFSKDDLQPVTQALLLDGAYAAHGGLLSPVKANVVQVQNILYELPPDLYSQSGSCYKDGEKTLINGFYYHVKFNEKFDDGVEIEKKSLLDMKASDIGAVVASSAKSIFINQKCDSVPKKSRVKKREGLPKLITEGGEHSKSETSYTGVGNAFCSIIDSQKEENKLRPLYDKMNGLKIDIAEKYEQISVLEKAKDAIGKGEEPQGDDIPDTQDGCDHAIGEIRKDLEEDVAGIDGEKSLKSQLEDAELAFFEALANAGDSYTEIDEGQKKILTNIIDACTGMQEMLTGALTLTGVAIAKLPGALTGLPDELKALTDSVKNKEAKAVYIPLRLARLRFNAGNVIDNIKGIATVIDLDLKIANNIKKEAKKLLEKMEASDA